MLISGEAERAPSRFHAMAPATGRALSPSFSVAGGDTASALAAGCPVVVKGHPAHAGTGEPVARALARAVATSPLPAGVFAYLPGESAALGGALVADPRIEAVGFTGSRAGALAARSDALAAAFVQSLTLGAGRFFTNPGLVLGIDCEPLDRFIAAAGRLIAHSPGATMPAPGIHHAYDHGVAAFAAHAAVRIAAQGSEPSGPNHAVPALFVTAGASFVGDPALRRELFGPAAHVVRCRDPAELRDLASRLEGRQTATLQLAPADEAAGARQLPVLAGKAGRVLVDGWPTGVAVGRAMVHGGPYPATSNARTTSVGTLAMPRFLRPVCLRNVPRERLPAPVGDDNPWRIARRIDGRREGIPQ